MTQPALEDTHVQASESAFRRMFRRRATEAQVAEGRPMSRAGCCGRAIIASQLFVVGGLWVVFVMSIAQGDLSLSIGSMAALVVMTYVVLIYFFCRVLKEEPAEQPHQIPMTFPTLTDARSRENKLNIYELAFPSAIVDKQGEAAGGEQEDLCAVCLEPKVCGQTCRELSCKHNFHTECLDTWWLKAHVQSKEYSCPLCRQQDFGRRICVAV
mmetsp:Transcript_166010/g.532907  ORF Transcript_166010/g.532907 Transcript_166010/m.532907 type:complete len:212 (+) Transcript_166010:30-665(+)